MITFWSVNLAALKYSLQHSFSRTLPVRVGYRDILPKEVEDGRQAATFCSQHISSPVIQSNTNLDTAVRGPKDTVNILNTLQDIKREIIWGGPDLIHWKLFKDYIGLPWVDRHQTATATCNFPLFPLDLSSWQSACG